MDLQPRQNERKLPVGIRECLQSGREIAALILRFGRLHKYLSSSTSSQTSLVSRSSSLAPVGT